MLRYVGSDDEQALTDLVWSVGGSPPYGGVSYEEAAAVYELLEDYRGPGAATDASYDSVRAFVEPDSDAAIALEIFRSADLIQSNPEGYALEPTHQGAELSRAAGHRGAEASFLSFEAGWHLRRGDEETARAVTLDALDIFLELADSDDVYAKRVQQSAVNAVSLTARTGDLAGARRLFGGLADVMEPDLAEQLRRALGAAS
jgi:hypothetical protein